MRTKLFGIGLVVATLGAAACVCEGEGPRYRLRNEGTLVADIDVKEKGGATETISGLAGGTYTDWIPFARGKVEFSITYEGVDGVDLVTAEGTECYDYTCFINEEKNPSCSGIPRD